MICPRRSHRTALIGRLSSQAHLPSQAVMLASSSPLLRAKNIRASSSTVLASRRATHWANTFQCPGGVTVPGPSSQYSAMVLRVSSSCLEYWVILSISSTYLPLGLPSGPRLGVGARWAELRRRGEGERLDLGPERGQEALDLVVRRVAFVPSWRRGRHAVGDTGVGQHTQRLPVVGVDLVERGVPAVLWLVAGVVR